MRKDLAKMLFIGLESDKKSFFEKAQHMGLVEFIGTAATMNSEHQGEITLLNSALKILRGLTPIEQLNPSDSSHAAAIAGTIVQTKHSIEKLIEKRRVIKVEIERIKPFGSFNLPLIKQIFFQFFVSKFSQRALLMEEEGLFLISSNENFDYWFSVAFTKRNIPALQELLFEKNLSALQQDLADTEEEIRLREQDLRMGAQYSQFLHKTLGMKLNSALLHAAEGSSQKALDDRLFINQGWIPAHKKEIIAALCNRFNVVGEEVSIEPQDTIPTYLENTGNSRIGEDLVAIYDTPSVSDKDPSSWVFWSFIIFFAMIINDAGYGLLFLLGTLYFKYKNPFLQGFGKRFVRLSIYLSTACIIWGIFTTSFFGVEVSIDSPFRRVAVTDWLVEQKAAYHLKTKDAAYQEFVKEVPDLSSKSTIKDFLATGPIREQFYGTTMFEFAILIGIIHMGLSMIRNIRRNWAMLGWLIFMVGGYLYFPVYLHATSLVNTVIGITPLAAGHYGLEMICVGGLGAFLLAIIQRRWGGLLEVMTLVQIFCDVLSYLRLYALGLAGMLMAATFNQMASDSGVFFGFFILLLGHTVNMTMGIMGGVIHGLRLNFLEWYHYSFEGGGRLFHPLKIYK
ncbi:MAG: V-type ATP synthase subunit I [Chlamydiota bacterium]